MLYVFHVDTGTMMTFEMNLALESVAQLKDVIERACRIPAEKQVLLVSGGESLEPTSRVCSYSAGTDTNPIYLFSKCTIESKTPPSPSIDYGSDMDLKEQVDGSLSMPATYNTVVVRAQLAQQFHELARDQTRICERLVHDQHLQQQGWAAVVANLEDITTAFRNRAEIFEQSFNQYLQTRSEFMQLLQNFKDDLAVLSKIPMIPALLICKEEKKSEPDKELGQEETVATKESSSLTEVKEGGGDLVQSTSDLNVDAKTLLQWISAKDNQSSLEQVAEMCNRGLEQFDSRVFEALKNDVDQALLAANNQGMKEIKGLGERLFGLEQLMFEAKRIVQEQGDLAQAFLQNQNRASNLGDASILPDLCASHRRQLLVMLKNHHQLRDIRRRCTRAKEELSTNLHTRLRWVMYVENCMCEMDSKLMIYHESLRRLRRSLEVVQQIHLTPQMYVTAVGEVVRRRTFSQAFLTWANEFASQLLAIHNEEVAKRKEFQTQFEGHFLNTLFPGMEDCPPPYATQAPSLFDSKLPKLSIEDLEQLRSELPEFNMTVSLPDLGAITQFFLVRSISGTSKTEKDAAVASTHTMMETTTLLQAAVPVEPSPSPAPKEQDRGFESETDTEEFEKVGQSPVKQSSGETGDEQPPATKEGVSSSVVATLEVGVNCDSGRKAIPSCSPSSSCSMYSPGPSHQSQQQEFTTADFYIDESMPSSYTESNSIKCHHQSAPELQRQIEDMHALIALLQENLGNTRDEVERLRKFLSSTSHSVLESAMQLRDDVSAVRTLTIRELESMQSKFQELSTILDRHWAAAQAAEEIRRSRERDLLQKHEQELLHRLTVDHELEMEALKQEVKVAAESKDDEIKKLKQGVEMKERELAVLRADMERRLEEEVQERREVAHALEGQLSDTRQQCSELQRRLDMAEEDKLRAVKDVQDRLTEEYKAEIEGLRSRFRRMANASMDRSPSDSSLEKIERLGVIELVNHEAILLQMREDMNAQHETAMKEALEKERQLWEARLEQELKQARSRSEAERQVWFNEAMRRVVGEKERQVEALRAREASLVAECQRHQDTIRRLTDDRDAVGAPRSLDSTVAGATIWPLLDRMERLETERRRLEVELMKERNRKSRTLSETAALEGGDEQKPSSSAEMSSSVAVVQDTGTSRDVATSPEPLHRSLHEEHLREKLTKSATSLIQQGKISIGSCNIGDAVLVVWDEEHHNYTILQETTTLYFLNSDCLDTLGLRPSSDGSPRKHYTTGEVIEKEYCHAKKPGNRYRVPKGTKFYRVKVRPLQKESLLLRSQHHHHHHHHQQQQQQQQQHQQPIASSSATSNPVPRNC
ncbi:RB1-inducible coiled-coil protein 1 isoform X2 [Anabrus simplex]|uniref:RB1-inducible coiled-coil protein 1 isoform X2 n=1 Tax=Anabrus simplex TaxID=316456 RepID=UPI0035A39871